MSIAPSGPERHHGRYCGNFFEGYTWSGVTHASQEPRRYMSIRTISAVARPDTKSLMFIKNAKPKEQPYSSN